MLRPYSALKLLLTTWNSEIRSGFSMPYFGPATELSLLFCPSSWKLLERPRWPFMETFCRLLPLLKLLSPGSAAPGTSSARLSKLVPSGNDDVLRAFIVVVICAELVSTSGVVSSTVTTSWVPIERMRAPRELSTPKLTTTLLIVSLENFGASIETLYAPVGRD